MRAQPASWRVDVIDLGGLLRSLRSGRRARSALGLRRSRLDRGFELVGVGGLGLVHADVDVGLRRLLGHRWRCDIRLGLLDHNVA